MVALSHREGEGVAINVIKKTVARPDGTSVPQFGLELGNAPVPDRRYAAEAANVVDGHDARMLQLTADLRFLKEASRHLGPVGMLF